MKLNYFIYVIFMSTLYEAETCEVLNLRYIGAAILDANSSFFDNIDQNFVIEVLNIFYYLVALYRDYVISRGVL